MTKFYVEKYCVAVKIKIKFGCFRDCLYLCAVFFN